MYMYGIITEKWDLISSTGNNRIEMCMYIVHKGGKMYGAIA